MNMRVFYLLNIIKFMFLFMLSQFFQTYDAEKTSLSAILYLMKSKRISVCE